LVAGGLSGVLAMSALIASGMVAVGGGAPAGSQNLAIFFCKGDRVLAVARPGEQMLVTGKSADGVFYRVYVPGPVGGGEGWVRKADVTLLADGPVPLAECGGVAQATGTPGPTASPTASATGGPTASPTPTARATAKATAKPTAPPTQAPPTIAAPTDKPGPTPNLGPVFTTQPTASATKLGIKQFTASDCGAFGIRTQLVAVAQDPDGVASMELWVQKPGAASYARLGHDFSKNGTTWSAFIDTTKDRVTRAGTLYFRAVAIDTKDVATTSNSGSITIFRCDAEATISGGINLPRDSLGRYVLKGCGSFSIPWSYYLSDPDGLTRASIHYTITHTNVDTLRDTIKLTHLLWTFYWTGKSIKPYVEYPEDDPYYGLNSVTWTVTTVDKYLETTAKKGKATVYYQNQCVE
jgi:hypothetical protein